jgi:hypothetical protein
MNYLELYAEKENNRQRQPTTNATNATLVTAQSIVEMKARRTSGVADLVETEGRFQLHFFNGDLGRRYGIAKLPAQFVPLPPASTAARAVPPPAGTTRADPRQSSRAGRPEAG